MAKLCFVLIESGILSVCVMVIERMSLVEFFKEIFNSSLEQNMSFIIVQIILLFTINIYGIVASIVDKCSLIGMKKIVVDEGEKKNEGKKKKEFSVEVITMYSLGIYEEEGRIEYKVIEETYQGEGAQYVFEKNGDSVIYYPIVYENSEVYILSRLYKEHDAVKIDYDFQVIRDKNNVESKKYQDIYNMEG